MVKRNKTNRRTKHGKDFREFMQHNAVRRYIDKSQNGYGIRLNIYPVAMYFLHYQTYNKAN